MNKTSRRILFTSFKVPEDPQELSNAFTATPAIKYACFQIETCPDTQRVHIQGYAVFKSPVRRSKLQAISPYLEGAHCEAAKGDDQSCVDYCTKSESRKSGPYEVGTRDTLGQGRRTDIQSLKGDIDRGDSMDTLWERHPLLTLRYFNTIGKIRLLKEKPRSEQTDFIYVFGPSGFGKSMYVQSEVHSAYYKDSSKWWDGYDGTQPVVCDDFYGWIKYDELLRLGNAHPYRVEAKGSSINFNSRQIWFTSNLQPDHVYKRVHSLEPFLRRLTRIILFTAFKELRIWETGDRSQVDQWAWSRFKASECWDSNIPVIVPGKGISEISQNTSTDFYL